MRKDYDAAAATRGGITVRIAGFDLDFPGDVPVDVAMEWYERQTVSAKDLGESARVYAETNYRLVLGTAALTPEVLDAVDALADLPKPVEDGDVYDVLARKAGQRTLDDLYRDLLDWWGLLPRPKEQDAIVRQLVGRIRVALRISTIDRERILSLVDELGLLLGVPVDAIDDEEETSAAVGGDPGNV